MGFSSQLNAIRSLLLRWHLASKRKKRSSARHVVGCVGKLRNLSIPTLSSLRSLREEPPLQRRRGRRKQRRDQEQAYVLEEVIVSPDGLPAEKEEFGRFTAVNSGYLETLVVDELRDEEYGELQVAGHVCLDYSGHGLFSQLQQELDSSSSSFAITHVPGDLSMEALDDRPHEGTVESDMRRRIMRFLNVQEGEYEMVFTASKGSAFKLLAESYPFDGQRNLLTMFDYKSEAVRLMQETARSRGSKSLTGHFNFPSLSVCSAHLKSQILSENDESKRKSLFDDDEDLMENCSDTTIKRKEKRTESGVEELCSTVEQGTERRKGLFVFPVQSRVSGTKYSYQWMSLAQDNGWHVLLDASALGPKDMDCLGLSLFRPDFMITSFYKVFGSDPTGFGCIFVKNSAMTILHKSEAARNIGMVRLMPLPEPSPVSKLDSEDFCGAISTKKSDEHNVLSLVKSTKQEAMQAEVAFSGPVSTWHKWTANMCRVNGNSMGTCMEEHNEGKEPASVNMSTGLMDCDYDKDAGYTLGKLGSRHWRFKNSKMPITPRSVLEETLLDALLDRSHDGESHELGESSRSGFASREDSKSSFDSEAVPTYYSHEISRQGNRWKCRGAFSQPLISRDIRENPLLNYSQVSSCNDELEFSFSSFDEDDDEEESSEFEDGDGLSHVTRREPEIYCRGLNHADSLGLNKTNDRLRFLMNWLITSMMRLQHLVSNKFMPLVHLYGPKPKYDRGASLAFNVFDRRGCLVQPSVVQELAHRDNISLGLGVLSHIRVPEGCDDLQSMIACGDSMRDSLPSTLAEKLGKVTELQVVTAALGFFTNFEDVFRLWTFTAKFLDAKFVAELDAVSYVP